MTIPESTTKCQPIQLAPCTDEQYPQVCPTCGRPYFGPHASGLLDLLIEAQDRITRAKATLETVVMP